MAIKNWKVFFEEQALKDFAKLDHSVQRQIQKYLRERLTTVEYPQRLGKPLMHQLKGFWRYCVGDYRLICRIIEQQLTIVVVELGHRRDIYE